jgi:Transposase, Mutator family
MLPSVNTVVHLEVKVSLEKLTINAVAQWLEAQRAVIAGELLSQIMRRAQEESLARVKRGEAELVCMRCGMVQRGEGGWTHKGVRERKIKTSSGQVSFPLLQIECLCGRVWAPCAEALGVGRQQRATVELKRKAVERACELSYQRSAATLASCLNVTLSRSTIHRWVQEAADRVELTPDPEAEVVLADGTKGRAGTRAKFEDVRIAVQVCGRGGTEARPEAKLRLIGLEVGRGTWPLVLPGCERTTLVVTDAEAAVEAHIREAYPNARHQFCEWHVGHSLNWSLIQDGVAIEQRKALRSEVESILWRKGSARRKRKLYNRFIEKLSFSPTSQKQLRRAAPHILFDEPSAERTTSLMERQMREVDRRLWIGVRWSVRGSRNLLLLSMTRKHNPDDFDRVWAA